MIKAIHKLFNWISSSSLYPKPWSDSIISPIPKKGDQYNVDNYRGIALSSNLSKLYCKILNDRLTDFLEKNNIINENQIGFRRGKRTTDHVFTLKAIIDKYLHEKRPNRKLYACYVDISKAFDRIWRSGLLFKMINHNIKGSFLKTIKSHL